MPRNAQARPARTRCKRGLHAMTPENTAPGNRCRACGREREAARQRRVRAGYVPGRGESPARRAAAAANLAKARASQAVRRAERAAARAAMLPVPPMAPALAHGPSLAPPQWRDDTAAQRAIACYREERDRRQRQRTLPPELVAECRALLDKNALSARARRGRPPRRVANG